MPPVTHPFEAALPALPASMTGAGALLRAGSLGTPCGSGGESGLVKGFAGVLCAAGAATRAVHQAPLRGASDDGGGPPPAAGLPFI